MLDDGVVGDEVRARRREREDGPRLDRLVGGDLRVLVADGEVLAVGLGHLVSGVLNDADVVADVGWAWDGSTGSTDGAT